MSADTAGALLVNGTVGSGTSTTAEEVGRLLAERGTPHAVVDLDALRRAWPAPPDDPFHGELELANLAAVAAVHGAREHSASSWRASWKRRGGGLAARPRWGCRSSSSACGSTSRRCGAGSTNATSTTTGSPGTWPVAAG